MNEEIKKVKKYTPTWLGIKMLECGLSFSKVSTFSDKKEFFYTANTDKSEIWIGNQNYIECVSSDFRSYWKQTEKNICEELKNEYYVCSLTDSLDERYFWKNYVNKPNKNYYRSNPEKYPLGYKKYFKCDDGICLIFNRETLDENFGKWRKGFTVYNKLPLKLDLNELTENRGLNALEKIFFYKDIKFKNDKEYRYIHDIRDMNDDICLDENNKYLYNKKLLEALIGIEFGRGCSADDKERIQSLLQDLGLENVKITDKKKPKS